MQKKPYVKNVCTFMQYIIYSQNDKLFTLKLACAKYNTCQFDWLKQNQPIIKIQPDQRRNRLKLSKTLYINRYTVVQNTNVIAQLQSIVCIHIANYGAE